jgi:hypothetical protein
MRLFPLLLLVVACEKSPSEPIENTTPSPNASILPAPLASVGQPAADPPGWTPGAASSRSSAEPGVKMVFGDAGSSPPEVLRADQPPDDDAVVQRELLGVSLQGEWRYTDLPPAPREGNATGVDAARRSTALKMRIDLAAIGRMRVAIESRAMALEAGSEIRARADRYGHVLVWPNGSAYRVLPLGAVRTLLGEGRADANPLVRAQSSTVSDGRRAARRTRKWELATRTGKLSLEQTRIVAAGEGGPLFCRFLSEIVAIDPSAAPCTADDVPLRAQFTWPDGGSIIFEVLDVVDKAELAPSQLMVPPAGAEFTRTGLPAPAMSALLTREELGALRLRPADLPPVTADEGFVLRNASDVLRYAFVDGLPAALVPPNHDVTLSGLARGRYVVQWRTFLADAVDPPAFIDLPMRAGTAPGAVRDR